MNSVLIIDDNKELCALMKNAWNFSTIIRGSTNTGKQCIFT